jgi:hypothetical protein
MKRALILLFVGLGAGCDDDTGAITPDMAASMFPQAPTIGALQIDRMGRAAVNTALTDPFYTDKTMHDAALDAYNKAAPSEWAGYTDKFAGALAVLDGLDGICGNQPLADASGADASAKSEYGTLAGILANDMLLVDTRVATCDPTKNYLAVEVGVITNTTPASCGGRTPLDNAIDVTYAALSGGLLSGVSVVNGATKDADANAATLTFPFLGAPQ